MKHVAADSPRKTWLPHEQALLGQLPSQPALLSNGPYNVRLSEVGSGFSEAGGVAVTRWTSDETRDADGFYIYLRDLDDGSVWSAGYQPTCVLPSQYEFRCDASHAQITRLDQEIECRLTVFVSPDHNLEFRNCRLTNSGDLPRRIELTSYLEWVLGSQQADANHPAFSKLFVETRLCSERSAILARRRPRHSDDSEFWGFHSVVHEGPPAAGDNLQFETNRMRFIGRGRTLRSPIALEPGAILSGDFGPVLDPIASIRLEVALEPGECREIAFVLGAGSSQTEIDDLIDVARDPAQIRAAIDRAMASDSSNGQPLSSPALGFLDPRIEETYSPATSEIDRAPHVAAKSEPLQFENGYGGFSADGREYVIRLEPDGSGGHRTPPLPWTNIIANEQAGFLVTERGAGYTWAGNSRVNRLTAWHNDPVCDPHGEAFGFAMKMLPCSGRQRPGQPRRRVTISSAMGSATPNLEHTSHELSQEITMFMARDEPVKLTRIRLANRSGRTRRLSLFSYLQWALGGLAAETAPDITTSYDGDLHVIWATNPQHEQYGECIAFSSFPSRTLPLVKCRISCDRSVVPRTLWRHRSPAAIASSATARQSHGQMGSIRVPPGRCRSNCRPVNRLNVHFCSAR